MITSKQVIPRLLSLVATFFLIGCAGIHKENLTPYEGLLAPGAVPAESRVAFNPAVLKSKQVVIVATSSCEAHIKEYADYYEGGFGESYMNFLEGVNVALKAVNPLAASTSEAMGAGDPRGLLASMRKVQDPRIVTDSVTRVLLNTFGKVSMAADFAEAQDLQADYIVLIDYWWKPNVMGTAFTGSSSVYFFDKDIKKIFTVQAKHTAPRPGVSAVKTFEQIHTQLSRQLTADLQKKFAL